MLSISPMISAILRACCWISPMTVATPATAALPVSTVWRACSVSCRACCARAALSWTLAARSRIDAAVCASDSAWVRACPSSC